MASTRGRKLKWMWSVEHGRKMVVKYPSRVGNTFGIYIPTAWIEYVSVDAIPSMYRVEALFKCLSITPVYEQVMTANERGWAGRGTYILSGGEMQLVKQLVKVGTSYAILLPLKWMRDIQLLKPLTAFLVDIAPGVLRVWPYFGDVVLTSEGDEE